MAISRLSAPPFRNKLLDLLKENDYRRLQPHLELVRLEFKQILYEPRALMNYAYFPREGVTSLITLMENGSGIEVASVGREGIVGVGLLFGVEKALARIIVQVPGTALRMETDILRDEISQDTPLRRLVMQSVACNGLHSLLQRCCRWLLTTRDRIDSDQFVMTHEFLAEMLGVRRSSVSEVLETLQKKGLIHYQRGIIQILNRKGLENLVCECYRSVKVEFDRLFAGR